MTLILKLPTTTEAKLRSVADAEGTTPAAVVERLIQSLEGPHTDAEAETDPTLALFAGWAAEDAAMTPEERESARRETKEFKARLNAERERAGARLMY